MSIGAVVLVLLLGGLLALWVLRKRIPARAAAGLAGNTATGVRRSATLRLDAKHTLHEIHWRDEALLLACGADGVRVIARKPAVASPEVVS